MLLLILLLFTPEETEEPMLLPLRRSRSRRVVVPPLTRLVEGLSRRRAQHGQSCGLLAGHHNFGERAAVEVVPVNGYDRVKRDELAMRGRVGLGRHNVVGGKLEAEALGPPRHRDFEPLARRLEVCETLARPTFGGSQLSAAGPAAPAGGGPPHEVLLAAMPVADLALFRRRRPCLALCEDGIDDLRR